MDSETVKALVEYRKKHHSVETSREKPDQNYLGLDEVHLSVSTNGSQFMSIAFTREEWRKIKRAVEAAWKE